LREKVKKINEGIRDVAEREQFQIYWWYNTYNRLARNTIQAILDTDDRKLDQGIALKYQVGSSYGSHKETSIYMLTIC